MHAKHLMIDPTHKIPIHYIDIPISQLQTTTQKRFLHTIASLFDTIGGMLKFPFEKAIATFTKGRHLTPGRHIVFSKYTFVDSIFRKIASLAHFALGLLGAILFSIPVIIGAILQAFSRFLHPVQFQYTLSHGPFSDIKENDETKHLTLLTRNAALVSELVSNYANLRSQDERLTELIASITSPREDHRADVLCMQEVFSIEHARKLVQDLQNHFRYFIYDIAPGTFGLGSGLFFASNKEVLDARFIRPSLPFFIQANNFIKRQFSVDGLSNKGIIYVLIKNGQGYDIVINAHIKSDIGSDPVETYAIEELRADALRVLAQGLFEYIDDVENRFNIQVNHVYFGGDLNVSDVQECLSRTYERTGLKDGIRVHTEHKDLRFIFDSLFPSPAIETWLHDIFKKPNDSNTGYGQVGFNDVQRPLPEVCFDHAGVFTYRDLKCAKHRDCVIKPTFEVSRFDDQGHSLGKGSPASDHAGLLLEVKTRHD